MISLWLYLRREFLTSLKSAAQIFFLDDEISQLSCEVAIVGGGISGLYVAETLLRFHKETTDSGDEYTITLFREFLVSQLVSAFANNIKYPLVYIVLKYCRTAHKQLLDI